VGENMSDVNLYMVEPVVSKEQARIKGIKPTKFKGKTHISVGKIRKRIQDFSTDLQNVSTHLASIENERNFKSFIEGYRRENNVNYNEPVTMKEYWLAAENGVFKDINLNCEEIPYSAVQSIRRLNKYAMNSRGNHVNNMDESRNNNSPRYSDNRPRHRWTNNLAQNIASTYNELEGYSDDTKVKIYKANGSFHIVLPDINGENKDEQDLPERPKPNTYPGIPFGEASIEDGVKSIFNEFKADTVSLENAKRYNKSKGNILFGNTPIDSASSYEKGNEEEGQVGIIQQKWNAPVPGLKRTEMIFSPQTSINDRL
jgi:hypothetical protein